MEWGCRRAIEGTHERSWRRRFSPFTALVSGLLAGCAVPPLVFEHPASGDRVDCSAEAQRWATRHSDDRVRGYGPGRGETPSHLLVWDYGHRCAAEMTGAGFVCVSGC